MRAVGYGGSICGFATNGDTRLDLVDIAFADTTGASFAGKANGGVLTVTDGTDTTRIKLSGDYLGKHLRGLER